MKIALLGSAPSSLRIAPFQDKEWIFWGCSPGVYGVAQRTEAWFELHRWEPGKPWFSPEYVQFICNYNGPVYMAEKTSVVKNCQVLPWEPLVRKYGPYFFTSSLSWMLALAIEQKPKTIGLWGVDMAASEEYGYQKAGCQYFIMLARQLGIEVYIPPESDLMRPPNLYGICELDHQHIKLTARYRELQGRANEKMQQMKDSEMELHFLKGAQDDIIYQMNTWIGHETPQPEVMLHPKANGEDKTPFVPGSQFPEEHARS
jgi:hypothetical protein